MCSDGVTPSVSTRVRNRPGVRLRDAPLEDQLHLIRPAQVEVLANHLLEEDAATQRPVQDLGQRELGLEDRYVVAIAGQTIRGGKRMGQQPQPLPQQRIDLVIREVVAELLQSSGVGAAQDAIVEGLKRDPFLGQLSLDVLVSVDAELGVIGEIGAELDEERAEVLVEAVEVVVVDHRRTSHDPGVGLPCVGIAALLGAKDGRLLLRLAHEDDPLVAVELGVVLLGDVVLALLPWRM